MRHVFVLVYILSLFSGVTAFSLYFFVYLRNRSLMIKKYLFFLVSYTMMILLITLGMYYFTNVQARNSLPDFGQNVYISIVLPCMGLLIYTMTEFYTVFAGYAFSGLKKRLFIIAALLSIPSLMIYWLFKSSYTGFFACMGYLAVFMGITTYNIIWLFSKRGKTASQTARQVIPVVILYFILSSLGAILEGLSNRMLIHRGDYPHGVMMMPLFYFIWNVLSIVFAYQTYLRTNGRDRSLAFPDRLAEQFGISGRERLVIDLLMKGKSNKEIADVLTLSGNTVRNHIYNVFLKMKIESRTELMNLVYTFIQKQDTNH